jgi:adenylate kinase
MGISAHYPVIIDGISGKGKHTALNFISQTLGFKVISFSLSSATPI